MARQFQFSFIIPALNEEKNIAQAIASINLSLGEVAHEIVVSDNGSSDMTVDRAKAEGATVVIDESATIAELRNIGVRNSTGNVLVFIDADVTLRSDWLSSTLDVLNQIPCGSPYLTGSTCSLPKKTSFVQRYWFSKLVDSKANYINSGHMIMSRNAFDALNGFDARLTTAEDYDICSRAKTAGISVFKSSSITAFHHGYPETITQFITREAWHGRQDFHDLQSFLQSKTAILASINILMITVGLSLMLFYGLSATSVLMLSIPLVISIIFTILKFGRSSLKTLIPTAACSQLYLIGRSLSPLLKVQRPSARA